MVVAGVGLACSGHLDLDAAIRDAAAGWPVSAEPPRVGWLDDGRPPFDAAWLPDGLPSLEVPWLEAGTPPLDWPCPDGWRRVVEDGVAVCEPFPDGGDHACADGQAHFPGETACAPVGRACGPGTFPDVSDQPAGTEVRYVSAGAPPGGDGTVGAPWSTLAEALDGAASGTLLVLSAGHYAVDRAWPGGVSVRGHCAADTALSAEDGAGVQAVIETRGLDEPARFEDLTVGPAGVAGVRAAGAGTEVWLSGVRVEQATGDPAALLVEDGARLAAHALVVRSTRPGPGGADGYGIVVRDGGELSVARGVIAANRKVGIRVGGAGSTAELRRVVVRDTLPETMNGLRGRGVQAEYGARLDVEQVLLEGNRSGSLAAFDEGTRVTAQDLVVRRTLEDFANPGFARGITADLGAELEVERALVEGGGELGVSIGFGAVAVLRDVVVRDWGDIAVNPVAGLVVRNGARLEVTRAVVERNVDLGFHVGLGGAMVATDLVVRDTRSRPDGSGGAGIAVVSPGNLTLSRALLERNLDSGLYVDGSEARAAARDVVVRDTRTAASPMGDEGGIGVLVRGGADLELSQVLVERSRAMGVRALGAGTAADLANVAILDTRQRPPDGDSPIRGINVARGATATIRGLLVEHTQEVGVFISSDADVVLSDVVVRGTTPIPSGAQATAIQVQRARASISRVLIEDTQGTGVLCFEGQAQLTDAAIRGSRPLPGGELGFGLVDHAGELEVAQVLLERNHAVGVLYQEGATGSLRDTVIRTTRPFDGREDGVGLQIASDGTQVEATRLVSDGNRGVGVFVVAGAELDAEDLTVRETISRAGAGTFGHGIHAEDRASIELRRALLQANQGAGVSASGASVTLSDLRVRGTRSPACAPTCADSPPGVGAGSYDGAEVTITRFVLSDSAVCGVQVVNGAALELRDGVVERHPIGACIDEGVPRARLRRNVDYRDNGTILEHHRGAPASGSFDAVLASIDEL